MKHSKITPLALSDLIQGCKAQRQIAQERLYRIYAPKMLGLISRYVPDKMEAEDVLLVGFSKVFSKIHTYSEQGSFEGWVKRIMINSALTSYRQNQRQIRSQYSETSELENFSQSYSISDTSHLLHLMRSLPDTLSLPFNLFAIEGYSHQEIAALLNITETLSKVRVLRARKLLQQRLQVREAQLKRKPIAA